MSAKELAHRLRARRTELASELVELHFERSPELARYGAAGRERCLEDAGHHLDYLAAALEYERPSIFVDYLEWGREVLAERGIPVADLESNLRCLVELMERDVGGDSEVSLQILRAGVESLGETRKQYQPPRLEGLAADYLDLLLAGRRRDAGQLILDAVDSGTAVRDVYLEVFAKAQRQIGLLWQANRITVAQEHYCTAATQLVMSQLYPFFFTEQDRGRRMVAAAVAGNFHEVGVRMVADFFELDGWESHYVGANAPTSSLIEIAVRRQADLLAISASLPSQLLPVGQLIEAVRGQDEGELRLILVGGPAFDREPEVWRDVGADLYASGPERAVELANERMDGQEAESS